MGPYKFLSYVEVEDLINDVGSALTKQFGLKPSTSSKPTTVGIYAKNRAEWVITELACFMHNMCVVSLYDSFGPANVEYVTNHSEFSVLFGTHDRLENFLNVVKKAPNLKHMVSLDPIPEKKKSELKSKAKDLNGIKIHAWEDILAKGRKDPDEPHPPLASSLGIIMYTSGTTGTPKGVMITHSNLLSSMSGVVASLGGFREKDVYLSYLPLAHIFERASLQSALGHGVKVGFYQGDVKFLTSDIAELRPTILVGVPRVFDKMHQGITNQVSQGSNFTKWMFKTAYKDKEKKLEHGFHGDKKSVWDSIVFQKVKEKVGGKLRFIISGASALSPEIQRFVTVCFGCPVVQGYGLTETCASGTIQSIDSYEFEEVGSPVPSVEIKLVDVPDLNYYASSKPPRGEIWIRGPAVSSGYYKMPDQTKEDFDDEGWFHTGDIGEWTDRNTLKIIDRKKNISKLANGEYVALEVLENHFKTSKFLTQLWIHCESVERWIVAVGVVNADAILEAGKSLGIEESDLNLNELCENEAVVKIVIEDLEAIAKSKKLNSYEIVRALKLVTEEFNTDNDYTTPTMKLKRQNLRVGYKTVVKELYDKVHEWEQQYEKQAASKENSSPKKPKKKDDDTSKTKKKDDEVDEKKKVKEEEAEGKSKKKDKEEDADSKSKKKEDSDSTTTTTTTTTSATTTTSSPKKPRKEKKDGEKAKKDDPEPQKKDSSEEKADVNEAESEEQKETEENSPEEEKKSNKEKKPKDEKPKEKKKKDKE
eukprot:TRINITY_DN5718_c0_g1_i2.p1 TRINITY_DN5718_c0_g1~~TRINITY_DN5718_c0_g1_i2.p1  ORF type:complete len:861 (-),score=179.38 TRINITY_DN5718_c0_g1_i2:192-2474(-)